MYTVWSQLWVWVALLGSSLGCGVSVHLSIVERLLPQLSSRIRTHASSVRAGAFYPDAFYDCMGLSEAAEESHWPPFLAKGAELVHEQSAIGKDTSKLEAFLVGVLSHQVADVAWHSLGLQQGLLRAMAESEFDGDIDSAHSVLDVGGDMIQVMRLQRSGQNLDWLNSAWDYNVEDIVEILRRLGYYASSGQVTYCMARGRAALAAEQRVATAGYKRYARQSPLLFDKLETYYVGGISDMTRKTEECLSGLLNWVDEPQTISQDPWNICQIFDGKRPAQVDSSSDISGLVLKQNLVHKTPPLLSTEGILNVVKDVSKSRPKSASKLERKNLVVSDTNWSQFGKNIMSCGTIWAVAAPGEGKVYLYDSHLRLNTTIDGPKLTPGQFEPEFGAALEFYHTQSRDGTIREVLLVSTPGMNRIDGYSLNGSWHGSLSFPNATTVYGSAGSKLIGEQLSLDFTTGVLYVGCPACDVDDVSQAGTVLAIPAEMVKKAFGESEAVDLDHEGPIVIRGTERYARVGARISVTPRFVLVGSPGTAEVFGLDRLTHKTILELKNGDGTGFGGGILCGNGDYIAIGAPLVDSSSQTGRIYMYKNNQRQEYALHTQQFADRLGQFGVFDGQKYVYAASSHAFEEMGALWRLNIQTGELAEMTTGPSPYGSGFGEALAINSTVVLVGLPHYEDRGAFASIKL